MGNFFSSSSSASTGASSSASIGASSSASKKGPGPDLSQYTYATKAQLGAKIKNGNFNPETDFAKMTEERIFQLFPDNKDEWGGGAGKRRRKSKKTRKVRKARKSRKN
jgi:hypothetical protein